MARFAPRIPHRLLVTLDRLDDRSIPIAETARRLGDEADRLGITRPSYQRIRELVHISRQMRRGPTTTSVLVDVAFRVRPADALLDHLSGVGVSTLRR